MPLDFPGSPAINDTWTASNGATYTFDGTKWTVSGSGVGPYLPLAGGTMTGALALAADPTTSPQAANKHYVDQSINLAGNYLGTWSVAANTPNISAGGSISNANYVATTVNPATPEVVPVGVPGIAGLTVGNGDRIIWASGLGVWQILRNAGVTLAAADARYYAITNPSGYQTAANVTTALLPYAPLNAIPGTSYADNGGFAVNQRTYVSGIALAAGAFGHDRWKGGAAGCTYTFTQSGNPATTITITAGTLQQVVEGVALVGGAYTLSWAGTAQGRVGAGSYAASPVTVGSITAGANTTIEFNAGTLGRVKFEAGSIATPWVAVPPQQDLARCQRFYQTGVAWAYYSNAAAGTIVGNTYPLPVTMRATPAGASILTPSNVNVSGVTFNGLGSGAMGVFGTATAAGTVNISNQFSASAEL